MNSIPKKSAATDPTKPLSKKEYAKKLRHDAYQHAKEFRKTDPRQIAMVEEQKKQRKAAYQKAKEQKKAYEAKIKTAAHETAVKKKNTQQKKLEALVVRASTLAPKPKPPSLS